MKQAIQTSSAPAAIGPYSQAIKVGTTLYISGQIPLDRQTNTPIEGDIAAQTRQIFKNIENIIKTANPHASLQNVVKTTVFLTDLNDFAAVNEVFKEVFQEPFPARSTIQAAALPKGMTIEIEAVTSLE